MDVLVNAVVNDDNNTSCLFLSQVESLKKEQAELNDKLKQLRLQHSAETLDCKKKEQEYQKIEVIWRDFQKKISILCSTKANLIQQVDNIDRDIELSKVTYDKLTARLNELQILRANLSRLTLKHELRVSVINEDLNEKHKKLMARIEELNEILRKFKEKENQLNQKLNSLPAAEVIQKYIENLNDEHSKLQKPEGVVINIVDNE